MDQECACGCGGRTEADRRWRRGHSESAALWIEPAGMSYDRALQIAVEFAHDVGDEPTPYERELQDRRDVVQRLHADGLNDVEIAAATGMAHETAQRWRTKLGLPANSHGGANTGASATSVAARARKKRNRQEAA